MTSLRNTALLVLAGFALLSSACSDDDTESRLDGRVGDDAATDGGLTEDGSGEDGSADGAGLPPAAPALTAPAADAEVFGSVVVSGSGEAQARVQVRILKRTQQLGSAVGTLENSGNFSLSVSYRGAAHQDELELEVVLSNPAGDSAPVTVALKHNAPLTLGGSISQSTGDTTSTDVYVRLYTSNAPEGLLDHVAELKLTATANSPLSATAFEFAVAAGTYYLRAFRDAGGARDGQPNGEPTLETDPQTAGALEVTVGAGGSTGNTLELRARSSSAAYEGLDARSRHETFEAQTPRNRVGGREVIGQGRCRGFYMQLRARLEGNRNHLGALYARLANGRIAQLRDDGACEDALDNSNSSYDDQENDDRLSYGLPNPTAADAGDYTFFYLQTQDDFLHIETDNVAAVRRISRLREIQSPLQTWTSASDLRPQVQWGSVDGASAYEVRVHSRGRGPGNDSDGNNVVTTTSYRPPNDLGDDTCYGLSIIAYDADPRSADIDAESWSPEHYFCVDQGGDDVITVAGTIENRTGRNAPVVVHVASDDEGSNRVSVRLAAGASAFSVMLPAGDHDDGGRLQAFVDADGSGEDDSPLNGRLSADLDERDFRSSVSGLTLRINPGPEATSPPRWATVDGTRPMFSWRDYSQTAGSNAPARFSYAVFINAADTEGFPRTIITLPSDQTSLDLSALPPANRHLDAVALANCGEDEGTPTFASDGTQSCAGKTLRPSVTNLESNTAYTWGVIIVECSFEDFRPDTGSTSTFVDCLQTTLRTQRIFAASEERDFRTPRNSG